MKTDNEIKSEDLEIIIVCAECDGELSETDGFHHDDYVYCQDCKKSLFKECINCNELDFKDGMTYVEHESGVVCNNCINDDYFYCDPCGEFNHNDTSYSDNNLTICEYCYENNFCTCCGCEDLVHRDDVNYDGYDDGYCNYCFEERNEYGGSIRDCGYRPDYQYKRTNNEGNNLLFLGIEVEVEQKREGNAGETAEDLINNHDPNENKFYIKEDGSLSYGFEVVSMPCTLKYHVNDFGWDSILKQLISDGCRSHNTGSCGIHVHASKRILTKTEQVRVGLFIHTQRENMSIFARRGDTGYTKFKDVKQNGYKKSADNYDRYEAVNFQNRHTIEFRLFKGTLKKSTFFASLQFVHACMYFVKTISSVKIVETEYAWNKFIDYVYSNKKIYGALIGYLKEKELIQ